MTFSKILVPTELDEMSAMVIDFAVELATELNIREIILLNIIIPAHSQAFTASGDVFKAEGDMAGRFNQMLMEKHKKLADKQAEERSTEKVKLLPYVRFNDSKTDLNEYMEYFNAGLIVSGSRDEQTFLEKLFGSDTEKIIRKTDYPMIILKEESEITSLKEIGLAIDVNEQIYKGVDEVIRFANAVDAKIQLVHVITNGDVTSEEAIKRLRELAIEKNLGNYTINVVNNHNLEHGLRAFIRKYNPDMMAVLSQGKGKIKKLIYGSGTEDIIKETEKPVFVSKML